MKHRKSLLSLSCIVLTTMTACQSSPNQPDPAPETVQKEQAIINGKPTHDEPSVVALIDPLFVRCNHEKCGNLQESDSSCIKENKKGISDIQKLLDAPCLPECHKVDEIIQICKTDDTNGSYTETRKCQKYNGLIVPMLLSQTPCNNACDENLEKCEKSGESSYYRLCDSETMANQNCEEDTICVLEGLNSAHCYAPCKAKGDTYTTCNDALTGSKQ